MNTSDFQRLAVVRLCGVGDAVQMTPLLRQMRADCPQAEIVCFVSANAAPVLQGAPWIDRLEALQPRVTHHSKTNPGLIRLWRQVARAGKFDALLCLGFNWRNLVLNRLTPARIRAGFVTSGWKPVQAFTHPYIVPSNAALDRKHESLKYLELWTRVSGAPDRGFGYDLDHLGRSPAPDLPKPARPYLCVAPGAGNPFAQMDNKKWPATSFARVMELALAESCDVLVLGSTGDIAEELLPAGAQNWLGRTTLEQAAALIRGARAFLGNDSGLYHLALGLGTPAAAVFGPTDPAKTGPFRNDNALALDAASGLEERKQILAVSSAPGVSSACMSRITPQQVWQQMQTLLRTEPVHDRPSCSMHCAGTT